VDKRVQSRKKRKVHFPQGKK